MNAHEVLGAGGSKSWRPRFLLLAAAAGLAVLALLLSACGGSTGPSVAQMSSTSETTGSAPAPSTSSGPTTAQAQDLALLEFSRCMRQHGIQSFPDPQQNAAGTYGFANLAKLRQLVRGTHKQDAYSTCQPDLVKAGIATPQNTAKFLADMLAFAKCMRSHGVSDFPDPNSNGRFGGQIKNLDPNSPTYEAAKTACQPYRVAARSIFTIPRG